jgi:putative tricarboxylic transport membrane protein
MQTRLRNCLLMIVVASAGTAWMLPAAAQAWTPERSVELMIPTSPGGSNDIAGRLIHRLWNQLKLLPVPSSVVNRSGGEHSVGYTYIQQRAGDAYAIGMMSTPMLLNPIQGRMQFSHHEVTPIAYLITEPMVAVVRADSPLKSGRDLMEALRKDPASVSIALTSTGHRISIGLPMHKAGVNLRSVRMPAFKGGGETATAVLGGHADVQITSVSTSVPHVSAGKMRVIAISSTQRLGGIMASVPTWQELGYPSSGSWKGVFGPKGLTAGQVAYWEEVMRRTAQSEEIRQYAEKNLWLLEFKGAAETRKWLDDEALMLKGILSELGLIAR